MPSQTSILSIAGKPTAISQPGSSGGKLRRWTGLGAGEPGGIQHFINRMFRTEEDTHGRRQKPHIMDETDVTKSLGLDNTDELKIQNILTNTRADFATSPHLRSQRLQHARSRLSDFLVTTKRIPSDVRMEINRRAMVWWRKFGKTDYEEKPMIRHVVMKAQVESPTLLKALDVPTASPEDVKGKAKPSGGEGAGGGGPFIGPKGGKWADPDHTIPWKEGGHGGAKHEEPAGDEQAAGIEDGGDGEGTDIPEFKWRISGQDHEQMAARLKEGITKASDLCKLSPPMCHENLGIERADMPQLDDDVLPAFLKSYQDKGVHVKKGSVEVGRLKATQKEISAETATGMAGAYAEGSFDPSKKPIIISKDGYVLDGHHRWAAMVVTDPASTMRVYQVDTDIQTLLKDAGSFKGVKQEAFGANKPPAEQPSKWTPEQGTDAPEQPGQGTAPPTLQEGAAAAQEMPKRKLEPSKSPIKAVGMMAHFERKKAERKAERKAAAAAKRKAKKVKKAMQMQAIGASRRDQFLRG